MIFVKNRRVQHYDLYIRKYFEQDHSERHLGKRYWHFVIWAAKSFWKWKNFKFSNRFIMTKNGWKMILKWILVFFKVFLQIFECQNSFFTDVSHFSEPIPAVLVDRIEYSVRISSKVVENYLTFEPRGTLHTIARRKSFQGELKWSHSKAFTAGICE